MAKNYLVIILGSIILVGLFLAILVINSDREKPGGAHNPSVQKSMNNNNVRNTSNSFAMKPLTLPFNVEDIDPANGVVNPLGVVRFSKDTAESGHSGIDIPLFKDSPIYATADGKIVLIKSASDPWGGQGVYQLIQETIDGEGWGFLYEHITPIQGLSENELVKAGDLIGNKTPPRGFTAHFQLTYLFNNFQFTRDNMCWPDFLDTISSDKYNAWWSGYSSSQTLINGWQTTQEGGQYPFRGLLDEIKYPNGLQTCYPAGTDAR